MPPDFKYRILATFIGVIAAFILARFGEWLSARRDKKKRRKELVCGIIRSLDRNLGLLDQVQNEFSGRRIPSFPMDAGYLEFVRPQIHELISDPNDAAEIESARFEIWHFETKLSMLRSFFGQSTGGPDLINIMQAAGDHLPYVERSIRVAREAAKKYEKG